jgi:hypothetical protein
MSEKNCRSTNSLCAAGEDEKRKQAFLPNAKLKRSGQEAEFVTLTNLNSFPFVVYRTSLT